MNPRMSNGWLCVNYDGHDLAVVRIGVAEGQEQPRHMVPAFLDYVDGQRVAKIRHTPMGKRVRVWLTFNGADVQTSSPVSL